MKHVELPFVRKQTYNCYTCLDTKVIHIWKSISKGLYKPTGKTRPCICTLVK